MRKYFIFFCKWVKETSIIGYAFLFRAFILNTRWRFPHRWLVLYVALCIASSRFPLHPFHCPVFFHLTSSDAPKTLASGPSNGRNFSFCYCSSWPRWSWLRWDDKMLCYDWNCSTFSWNFFNLNRNIFFSFLISFMGRYLKESSQDGIFV